MLICHKVVFSWWAYSIQFKYLLYLSVSAISSTDEAPVLVFQESDSDFLLNRKTNNFLQKPFNSALKKESFGNVHFEKFFVCYGPQD